jgi:hypothetical protein
MRRAATHAGVRGHGPGTMGGVDPLATLGLGVSATPEEVAAAYRSLAKRWHPDRAGNRPEAARRMAEINAAYDLLRDGLEPRREHAQGSPTAAPGAAQGSWLTPGVRRVLARELLLALDVGETVDEVVLTATSDSHDVQLVVTDRRLLWLRDDAIMGRVRSLRYRDVRRVERREGGRLRRLGHLRIQAADGGRLRFFDLHPELLGRLATAISARTPT